MRQTLLRVASCATMVAAFASSGSATETVAYTYDAKGRLIVKKSTGTVNNNETHSYCYDRAGNRITYNSNETGTPAACVTDGT